MFGAPRASEYLLQKVLIVVELDQVVLVFSISVVLLDSLLNFRDNGVVIALRPENDHLERPFALRYKHKGLLDFFQKLIVELLILALFGIRKGFGEDKNDLFVRIVVSN